MQASQNVDLGDISKCMLALNIYFYEDEGIKELIDVLTSKLSKCEEVMASFQVRDCMFGLRNMRYVRCCSRNDFSLEPYPVYLRKLFTLLFFFRFISHRSNHVPGIAELLEANWKQSEIARELGISASAVCQHVKHIKEEQADDDVVWSEN